MKDSALKSSRNAGKRLLIIVFGGILFLSIYFIANLYLIQIKHSRKEILNKLEAVANAASILVSGEDHEYILGKFKNKDDISSNTDDSIYFRLHRKLKELAEKNNLSTPIRTFQLDSSSQTLIHIITASSEPNFRHTEIALPNQFYKYYILGGSFDSKGEKNENILNTIVPVFDSKGIAIGFVKAEQDYHDLINSAKMDLYKNIGISLIIFALVYIVLYAFIKSLFSQEESFKHWIIEQNQEIVSKNEEIELQNTWIQESNNKLEEAKKVIENHNRDLKIMNQVLDMKVMQRTRELELVNKDLSSFLYRSSHDIMGPLATLQGLCNIAGLEVKEKAAIDFIAKFQVPINKLNRIIKSVNAIFNIKTKELEDQEIILKDFIQGIIDKKIKSNLSKPVNFKVKVDQDVVIHCDPVILESIFTELINNCITNINPQEDHPYIMLSSERSGKRISIKISDNGNGLDDKTREKILGIFRNPHTISDTPGMGLYIVKSALSKLKGDIKLLEEQDHKATFEIVLKLKYEITRVEETN
jgi:signal transduction histidine kinase